MSLMYSSPPICSEPIADVQFLRHEVERHFDFDRVDQMLDDAAVVHARCFALELDRHLDRHLVARLHAEQVDVQHLMEERVPSDFLQQRLAGGRAFEVDDLRTVADDRFELLGASVRLTASSPCP